MAPVVAKSSTLTKKESKPNPQPSQGSKFTGIHKKDSGKHHHGVEETLKRAAEEEAERQRQAAAAEEAKSAAALREEESKSKNQSSHALLNDEDTREDLLKWVQSVPLSRPCVNRIDRAFSDGSLVAEVINYYCPSICDKRAYFQWSSRSNKMSNWEALNHKVFPKLGFRLNQKQIDNILNPFRCGKFEKDCEQGMFIYKLLDRIRKELADKNPSVLDYQKPNFVAPVCEVKPPERKLKNFLDDPPFSKVEWLVEQGYYDKDKNDKNKKDEKDEKDDKNQMYKDKMCKDKMDDKEKNENISEPVRENCSCDSKGVDQNCSFGMPLPYSIPGCITFELDQYGANCDEIFIQPTLSCNCNWSQPTRCFLI